MDSIFTPNTINAEHKDLIHDVAFDYYGIRMATCSSDQFIKVWNLDQDTNEWKQSGVWKAHSGPVWKVNWAHPEFGHVIASCSFDRTVAVWEEITSESGGLRHWARRTNLVDSRTSVTDVKFAPRVLGLMLATCSADGLVRIYEAPDSANLSQWTLQHELPTKLSCSCISWNHLYMRDNPKPNVVKVKSDKKEVVFLYQTPLLAVGCDDSVAINTSKVIMFHYSNYSRRWVKIEPGPSVTDPVHDISFAPKLGRSYDLVAVATKDVRIFSVAPYLENSVVKFEINLLACFDDHNSSVWRLAWNNMGNILTSSGDDGWIRMWKCFTMRSESPLKRREAASSAGKSSAEEGDTEKSLKSSLLPEYGSSYLGSKLVWKCTAVIKADGRPGTNETSEASEIASVAPCAPPPPPVHSVTTRYFKLANINNPTQVPWH